MANAGSLHRGRQHIYSVYCFGVYTDGNKRQLFLVRAGMCEMMEIVAGVEDCVQSSGVHEFSESKEMKTCGITVVEM